MLNKASWRAEVPVAPSDQESSRKRGRRLRITRATNSFERPAAKSYVHGFLPVVGKVDRIRVSRRLTNINLRDWIWVFLLGWVASVYLLVHLGIPKVVTGGLNIYLAQPVIWITLGLLALYGWRVGLRSKPAASKRLIATAILAGLFQVALFAIAGLTYGFGFSPYGHSALVLLGNSLYVVTILVAVELSRAYLVVLFSRGSATVAVASTALLFSVVGIPLGRLTSIAGPAAFFEFTGATLLPLISQNLLASFLALIGGPLAAIAYLGTLQAFEWYSPILPDLTWIISAFIGTMAPTIGLLVVRSQYFESNGHVANANRPETGSSTAWVLMAAVGVALLWFNTGLFGVRPTLVSGVSMEPTLRPADIVITWDVPVDEIEVGDIVRYHREGTVIIHRVVEVYESSGLYFVTKGDANNVLDSPILPGQIDGKVILTLPKIGWLSIGVRNLLGSLGAMSILLPAVPLLLYLLLRRWRDGQPSRRTMRPTSREINGPRGQTPKRVLGPTDFKSIGTVESASNEKGEETVGELAPPPEIVDSQPLLLPAISQTRHVQNAPKANGNGAVATGIPIRHPSAGSKSTGSTYSGDWFDPASIEPRRTEFEVRLLPRALGKMDQILGLPVDVLFDNTSEENGRALREGIVSSIGTTNTSSRDTHGPAMSPTRLFRWAQLDGKMVLDRPLSQGMAADLSLEGARSKLTSARGDKPRHEVIRGVS